MKLLNNSVTFDGTEYRMQSMKLQELCEKVETPFYVYDADYIVNKYEELKKCFPYENLRVFYAVKANFNPHLLKIMKEHDFYLDAVSPAEVLLALKLGFSKDRIMFTANNMTDKEMQVVKEQGVILNIDSLPRLEAFGQAYPGSEVCIRFNPNVLAGENARVMTGGALCKFGILLEDVEKVLSIARTYNLKIVGVHEHTGSGIADTGKVYQSMTNLLSIVTAGRFPDLRFVDFGGGFKVPYEPDEEKIDYKEFGKRCVTLFEEFCRRFGKKLLLMFEPGKYLVAESGCLVVRVNTIKNNKGKLIVGTDSGFPQLIRPVFYGAYHHVINVSNPNGAQLHYDIYGNTCESGDCFAEERGISAIHVGDYLAIQNAGAYCRSMASEYNLRPLPTEVILKDNQVIISKKKLTHEELAERIMKEYGVND